MKEDERTKERSKEVMPLTSCQGLGVKKKTGLGNKFVPHLYFYFPTLICIFRKRNHSWKIRGVCMYVFVFVCVYIYIHIKEVYTIRVSIRGLISILETFYVNVEPGIPSLKVLGWCFAGFALGIFRIEWFVEELSFPDKMFFFDVGNKFIKDELKMYPWCLYGDTGNLVLTVQSWECLEPLLSALSFKDNA